MKKLLALSLIPVLLTSCYTYTRIPIGQVMDEWMGKTEHQVIMRFGAPTNITPDGEGGKVLMYERSPQATTVFYPETAYSYASAQTYTNSYYLQFYIDKSGEVYSWRTNLPDQRGERQFSSGLTIAAVLFFIVIPIISVVLAFSN